MSTPADAVQKLVAESQIRGVIARYARGVDRRDGALIGDCFHAGALTHYGDFDGYVDTFVPWVLSYVEAYSRTMHFMGTSLIDWPHGRADDQAIVETYAAVLHEKSGDDADRSWVGGIRYLDRFERRSVGSQGSWRIAERTVVGDWLRIDPAQNHRRFPKQLPVGRAGRDDPILQLLSNTFGAAE